MKTLLRNSAGMTVTEVIVALGVITFGLLALIAAMPLSTSMIAESNLKTTATFLAQQHLERIKNTIWTVLPAADTLGGAGSNGAAAVAQWPDEAYGTITFPGAGNCTANDHSGGCRFRRQVRIIDCSVISCSGIPVGTVNANTLRQVTVSVFFRPTSGAGQSQTDVEESVQLGTLIARR